MHGRRNSSDLREKLKGLTTNQVMLASRGPTMEEAVEMNAERQRELAEVQPREVLRQLQEGNSRFWMGLADRPEMSAMERRALIMQQSPKVRNLSTTPPYPTAPPPPRRLTPLAPPPPTQVAVAQGGFSPCPRS